ncbi:hypothetical protein D1632_05405 [Chryseobacterium nematophagum]|uniref:RHS repeat protein n=1 Tax=Chryseobacterium nematophagum TaxID=2305228 RepID=A0A3M7LE61_9FLAO|nr:hypothetical protein [Chryseobacterium nematophagum]RMZ60375.1 hypothetical protein D1632_05405 [Chryseobacterium nematophagum]
MNKVTYLIIIPAILASASYKGQAYWRDMQTINANRPQINKPELSSLSDFKITDDHVDLSTGTVRPSLALVDISTKTLSETVNLSYDKGKGIRVNDISSDVGLGWELQAGGYITRKVNGFADESKLMQDAKVGVWANVYTVVPNKQKSANGWLDFANWNSRAYNTPYNGSVVIPGQPYNNQSLGGAVQALAQNIKNNVPVGSFRSLWAQPVSSGTIFTGPGSMIADLGAMFGVGWDLLNVDGEPDEFYFRVGKYSGKFVFDGNRTPTVIPYIPGLKIQSPFNSTENKWIITTPEGIKYTLPNTPEYTETLYSETETTPEYDNSGGINTPDRNEGIDANEYTSKWYLSKVEGISGDYIEYTYENSSDLIYNEKSFIKQVFRAGRHMIQTPPSYFLSSGDHGFYERELPRNTDFRLRAPKRLSAIKTSDNNRIIFTYNGLERQDVDQSQNGANKRKSLSSIEKYDFNNKRISKMELEQDYFTGGCADYKCKRLKLNNLKLIGSDNNQIASTGFEYNMIENLPSRNAFQQDFWGYYNSNSANTLVPEVKYPSAGYDYPGADRRPSENKTKAGILTKIIYPTKGSVEYDYELNNFNTGADVRITNNKTGGLRIKNIIKKENDSASPIITTYQYELSNGQTSGEIHPFLLQMTKEYNNNAAGRLIERQVIEINENTGARAQYMVIYSNPKYLYTEDLIRYSKVIVNSNGKGKKEYSLSSFSTHPDGEKIGRTWRASSSSGGYTVDSQYFTDYFAKYSNAPATTINNPDKSYLRGLTLNIKETDNNGVLIKETTNNYQINPSGYIPTTVYGLGVTSSDLFLAENSNVQEVNYELTNFTSDYVFQGTTIVKDYLGSNNIVSSTENNTFNSLCLLDNKNILLSDNNLLETSYKYANDKQIQKLITANIINLPLETERKKNGKIISKGEIKFDNPANLFPSSAASYDLQSNSMLTEITYDKYDSKGNLLQYTTQNGVSISIIWGYNQTQPIAKIEGAMYNQVEGFISGIVSASDADAAQGTQASENALIAALDAFRNLPNLVTTQITTYTYNPQIGVTSITPTSGVRENYIYDSANRLEKVVDVNGKVLKEYKYNYKN